MPTPSFFQRIPIALLFVLTLALTSGFLVALAKPAALVLAGYKLHVLLFAGLIGWWLDHVLLFPYARPAGYLAVDWRIRRQHGREFRRKENRALLDAGEDPISDFPVINGCGRMFMVACLRRALVVAATLIAAALVL